MRLQRDAQVGNARGFGKYIVQGTKELDGCGVQHASGCIFLHQQQLALVQMTQAWQVFGCNGKHRTRFDVGKALGHIRRHRARMVPKCQGAVCSCNWLTG